MKRKIDPAQPFVGIYRLGLTNVELYGTTGATGGQFFVCPDATSLPRIKIGLAYDHWWEVVNVLLHESFEYLAAQRNVRFELTGCCYGASDGYRFFMDHNAFTNICDDQAYFLAKAMPDLARVWNARKKKK